MSKFLKALGALVAFFSAFLLGYKLGKEKEKAKIPSFQDESDRSA
jgi:hypothetical protein